MSASELRDDVTFLSSCRGCFDPQSHSRLQRCGGAIGVGGQVTILDGGLFGPIKITQSVTIEGSKADATQIVADPSAQVGCIGALPSSCGLTNNGYAVEIAAGINDSVKIFHVFMGAGPSGGAGALMFTSGGTVHPSLDRQNSARAEGALSHVGRGS